MNSNRRSIIRRATWCATAGFAATLAGEVMAQTALEEIVVTARKREESIQDIPVAVTAFTSEELAKRGITQLEDVAMYTPASHSRTSPRASRRRR